jgi:hypothetical protein
MNSKERENLFLAVQKYKHVCISLELYCEFLTDKSLGDLFGPVSDRDILKLGLYGKIDDTSIYVSRMCDHVDETLHIRVSNIDVAIARVNYEAKGWSPLLKLEDFDRLDELKAFW